MDLLHLSARSMAQLIRAGQISSAELMAAHIRQIETLAPALNAVVTPLFDSAMQEASARDQQQAQGQLLGPLHGVPVSIKDSIDVRGVRTTAGTVGLADAPAAKLDAVTVARLRAAGAIPIAKTNLPDLLFAYESDNLIFGRTNNPYDPERTSGGSSGGESALIASYGSPLGLGSDAAGSVRVPAAFCGIGALKPTSGRFPRTGHVPPFSGWIEALWQIGPMARHVEDLQLALNLMTGPGADDWTSPPVLDPPLPQRPLRIAFFIDNGFVSPTREVADAVIRAARALEEFGFMVEEALPPGAGEEAYEIELALIGADGCRGLYGYIQEIQSTRLHPLLESGFVARARNRACATAELAELWTCWDAYRRGLAGFFSRYDAVLSPVYIEPALLHGQSVLEEKFRGFSYTIAWNVGGNPAATVRFGSAAHLPINVQIAGQRWHDGLVLHLAQLLEEAYCRNAKDTGEGTE